MQTLPTSCILKNKNCLCGDLFACKCFHCSVTCYTHRFNVSRSNRNYKGNRSTFPTCRTGKMGCKILLFVMDIFQNADYLGGMSIKD